MKDLTIRSPTGVIGHYVGKPFEIRRIINNLTLGASTDDYVLLAPEPDKLELYFIREENSNVKNNKDNHNNCY